MISHLMKSSSTPAASAHLASEKATTSTPDPNPSTEKYSKTSKDPANHPSETVPKNLSQSSHMKKSDFSATGKHRETTQMMEESPAVASSRNKQSDSRPSNTTESRPAENRPRNMFPVILQTRNNPRLNRPEYWTKMVVGHRPQPAKWMQAADLAEYIVYVIMFQRKLRLIECPNCKENYKLSKEDKLRLLFPEEAVPKRRGRKPKMFKDPPSLPNQTDYNTTVIESSEQMRDINFSFEEDELDPLDADNKMIDEGQGRSQREAMRHMEQKWTASSVFSAEDKNKSTSQQQPSSLYSQLQFLKAHTSQLQAYQLSIPQQQQTSLFQLRQPLSSSQNPQPQTRQEAQLLAVQLQSMQPLIPQLQVPKESASQLPTQQLAPQRQVSHQTATQQSTQQQPTPQRQGPQPLTIQLPTQQQPASQRQGPQPSITQLSTFSQSASQQQISQQSVTQQPTQQQPVPQRQASQPTIIQLSTPKQPTSQQQVRQPPATQPPTQQPSALQLQVPQPSATQLSTLQSPTPQLQVLQTSATQQLASSSAVTQLQTSPQTVALEPQPTSRSSTQQPEKKTRTEPQSSASLLSNLFAPCSDFSQPSIFRNTESIFSAPNKVQSVSNEQKPSQTPQQQPFFSLSPSTATGLFCQTTAASQGLFGRAKLFDSGLSTPDSCQHKKDEAVRMPTATNIDKLPHKSEKEKPSNKKQAASEASRRSRPPRPDLRTVPLLLQRQLVDDTLYVKGFDNDRVSEEEVANYFQKYECQVVSVRAAGRGVLIRFQDNQTAVRALSLNGYLWYDSHIIHMAWRRF